MNKNKSWVLNIVLWVIGLLWFAPVFGIAVASFRPSEELGNGWWQMAPLTLQLDNYWKVLFENSLPLWRSFLNSLLIAISGTLIALLLGVMSGYSFIRHEFPLKKIIIVICLLFMALPLQIIMVPVFEIMHNLKLLNNPISVILMDIATALPWIIFFSMANVKAVPISMEESAALDGATSWQVFTRVLLPNLRPSLLAIFTLQFVWSWLGFLFPLIFLYDSDLYTMVQVIPLLRGHFVANWGQLSAASLLTILAPLGVFLFLQKYYLMGMGITIDK